MKNGDIVELINDTQFYKSGTKAIIINVSQTKEKMEIRYVGENYIGEDVDVMPKKLFRVVTDTK